VKEKRMEMQMKNETWLTIKAIGDKAQIEGLIATLSKSYTVVTSSALMKNDRGEELYHIFLKLFAKSRGLAV
jgi:hypothetical protein